MDEEHDLGVIVPNSLKVDKQCAEAVTSQQMVFWVW